MSKKNSIYIFISIFFGFLIIGQIILESRIFAKWFYRNVVSEIAEKNEFDLEFERLNLRIKDKRLMLDGVKFQKGDILIQGNIGFGLNSDLLFSKKLNLSKIILEKINLKVTSSNEIPKNKKVNQIDFYKLLNEYIDNNGIKELDVSEMDFTYKFNSNNSAIGHIKDLNIIKKLGGYYFELDSNNITFQQAIIDSLRLVGNFKANLCEFNEVEIRKGLSKIFSKNLKIDIDRHSFNGDANYKLFYEDLEPFLPEIDLHFEESLSSSFASGDISLKIQNKNFEFSGGLNLKSFNDNMTIENVHFDFDYKDYLLKLKRLEATGREGGTISNREIIYNINKASLVSFDKFAIENLDVLATDPLIKKFTHAFMGGVVSTDITYDQSNSKKVLKFNNSNIKKYCLKNSKMKSILCAADVRGNFTLKKDKYWSLDIDSLIEGNTIKAKATIRDNEFFIESDKFNFDHNMLSEFFGLDLIGNGQLKISYSHSEINKKLNIFGALDNFSIQKFNLGKIKANIYYDFFDGKLFIKKADGVVGDTEYTGFGKFDFNGDVSTTDLSINMPKMNINNLLLIMPDYLGESKNIIGWFNSFGRANVRIQGPLDIEKLSIVGQVDGREITFFKEDFKNYNAIVSLKNKKLFINPFSVSKNNSILSGEFFYDFNLLKYNLNLRTKKMNLNNFYYYRKLDIGLNSDFLVDINLSTDDGLKIDGRLLNSQVRQYQLGESSFSLVYQENNRKLSIDLFDHQIKLQTGIQNIDNNKPYFFNTEFSVPNIDTILGILSVKNLEENIIQGAFNFNLNLSGDLENNNKTNIDLDISEFSIRRNDLQLALVYPRNKILVKNGIVTDGNVLFSGPNQEVALNIIDKNGSLFMNFDFSIPGSIFEIFPQFISSWVGLVDGNAKFKLFDLKTFNFNLNANTNEIKINNVPDAFLNVKFNIFGDYNFISIDELSARIGGGVTGIEGFIELQKGYPKIDLNYFLSSAKFNITDYSKVNVGGFGRIFGNTKPYFLNGSVNVLNGEFNDDPKLFFNADKSNFSKNDFKLDLFDFNIDLNTLSLISIKNSLADLKIGMQIKYQGNKTKQSLDGSIKISENESKLYFKGHEFKVIKGNVRFRKNNETLDPYFDILSDTKIGDYNLEMEINGDVKNLNVAFRSDPPLAESDILSLLTLGITLDTTKDLQDSDLESVTSMSLGSLLIDQFGINQGLHDSLGIKVSLGPEFNEYNNPISGKINSSNDTSRLRSATKIRLSKRISNSINLNYSSTLGGSLDQSQQMNINLKINNDMSLQGVYRTQSNEKSESIDNTESIGFDFIWKKTFK